MDRVSRAKEGMEKGKTAVHQCTALHKNVFSQTLRTLDQYLKVSGRSVAVDLQFLSILHCMVRYGNYETYIYTFTQSFRMRL